MRNLSCQKRRRIVIRNKDGGKREERRCANGITQNYRKTVDESICQSCVLRQPLLKIAPTCKEHPPADPIWPEPCYRDGEDIVYLFQDGVQQPSTPQGYRRKSDEGEESWWFVTEWDQCSYRRMVNQRTPRGDLQVHAHCEARDNSVVSHEECKQCVSDMTKVGGNLDEEVVKDNIPSPEPVKEGVPNFPSAGKLLDNYWKAVKKWVASGRPARTDSEVAKIHREFCAPCDWYDSESQRCKGCGCAVKPKGIAILNKIKMKTEHCPRNFW